MLPLGLAQLAKHKTLSRYLEIQWSGIGENLDRVPNATIQQNW